MLACTDVGYRADYAVAACVLFADWTAAAPTSEHISKVSPIVEYVSGEFYRRELPCLLEVLKHVQSPLDAIIIDGFVWLEDGVRKGLGAYLYEAVNGKIPVIGVAKTRYRTARALEVCRGKSSTPLFITAIGMDTQLAAQHIQSMHGEFRIPTLIKRVDFLSRQTI